MVSLLFADAHCSLIISSAAHEAGTLPLSFECAAVACAPEVAFARFVEGVDNPPIEPQPTSGPSVPLCAPLRSFFLSLTLISEVQVYEIVTGYPLFDVASLPGLLHRMAAMADSLPPTWLNWYSSLANPPEVSPSSADAWWQKRREEFRKCYADEASVDGLVNLLKKVLVLDPASRPTAAQVLRDPWFPHTDAKVKPTNTACL
jgi:serine/threonine-protein kinase SRPK3